MFGFHCAETKYVYFRLGCMYMYRQSINDAEYNNSVAARRDEALWEKLAKGKHEYVQVKFS